MKTIARNILAAVAGLFVGGIVNMALVTIGPTIIPVPEGIDMTTAEGLKAGMELLAPVNFVFPFLAHALGTLVGAFLAAKLAASRSRMLALFVGVFFLVGGISAVKMFGGPLWFKVVDLGLAYIPMGFLGGALADRFRAAEAS